MEPMGRSLLHARQKAPNQNLGGDGNFENGPWHIVVLACRGFSRFRVGKEVS